ncbi:hypothetical protein TNCT_608041 [Trichonephila clavata]|uniref:Uncharacterized protein n=1 Tax=Trichonephila clavata TaxID=2740835 RepID=A0A8X6J7Q1_TRICU|nr:hypothetical protein TNCT_608041 [Trichonephila clavata]
MEVNGPVWYFFLDSSCDGLLNDIDMTRVGILEPLSVIPLIKTPRLSHSSGESLVTERSPLNSLPAADGGIRSFLL